MLISIWKQLTPGIGEKSGKNCLRKKNFRRLLDAFQKDAISQLFGKSKRCLKKYTSR